MQHIMLAGAAMVAGKPVNVEIAKIANVKDPFKAAMKQ
jgi:hypothetical protein